MLAKPTNNLLYQIERPRLANNILQLLGTLKANPSKEALGVFQTNAKRALDFALVKVADSAYVDAARDVEMTLDPVVRIRVRREALQRASQASAWITDTTGVALGISAAISKSRVASKGRADLIAVNNLAVAFFRGTRFGWGLDKRSRKSWELSDAHDKDDLCDDNSDEGPIGIDEAFQSGDFEPPAHVLCDCFMRLTRAPK